MGLDMAGYVVRRGAEAQYLPPGPLLPGAVGMTRWRGVGEQDGSTHSDFGVTRIEPGGRSATHVHSFEESFHVIEGEVVLATPEATVHLVAGDYGIVPSACPIGGSRSGTPLRPGRTSSRRPHGSVMPTTPIGSRNSPR